MQRLLPPLHGPAPGVAWTALCRTLGPPLLSALLLGACTPGGDRPPVTGPSRGAAPVGEEHEIAPGKSQSYPVDLEAGHFVQAVVDQGDVDVALQLLDPEGHKVGEMDSLDRTVWDEELAAVAERSGRHQIVVVSGEKKVTGRYRLWIAKPRRATEADRLRARALGLSYEATIEAAQQKGTEESYRLQLGLREQALAIWRRLGDRPRAAEALYQLGTLHKDLGDDRQCSELLQRALAGLTDDAQRAQALNQAGQAAWDLGAFDEARALLDEGLLLADRSGDRRLEFDLLNNLGRFHTNVLGEPRTALDRYLLPALRTAEESGYARGQASVLNNIGSAYQNLSEDQKALERYLEALDTAKRLENQQDAADATAVAVNNIANAYHSLGDLERARDYFEQALPLIRESGDKQKEEKEATTRQNLGVVAEKLERVEEALRSYDEALRLARQVGKRDLQASILTNLAYLDLRDDRDPRRALAHCQEALPLAERQKTRARTLHMLGAAQRKVGNLLEARQALTRALELGEEDLALRADVILVLAKVERDAGDLEKAGELAADAIETIEQLRDRVVRQDLREWFFASKQGFYEFYIDVLMELEGRNPGRGFAAKALEMNERARARGLLDLLAELGADLNRDADAGLAEQERQLSTEVVVLYQRLLKLAQEGVTDERATQAKRRLEEAIEKLHQVNAALKTSSPRYAALTRPELLSARAIQEKVLDRDSLLLVYALGEERSWLWLVARDFIVSFPLPGRAEIERAARSFYDQLSKRPDKDPAKAARAEKELRKTGAALARMLLGQAQDHLRNRRLLMVTDGALAYIPFGALPSSLEEAAPFLAETNEIVYILSASTLAVLREEESKRRTPGKIVAAIGNPVFQEAERGARMRHEPGRSEQRAAANGAFDPSRLPPLPYSELEVERIVAIAGKDQSLKALGLDASRSLVTSGRLDEFQIVHLATHGSINTENPELSALAFSRFNRQGEPELQEGLLSLADIYRLRLNADLVTLSACETALGKEMRGEGLIGLTRGFMYAGSSRVLASLWKIEDRTTAQLMLDFYKLRLKDKRTVPAALREAQLKALRDPLNPRRRHPYYWAGFSLQGEPR